MTLQRILISLLISIFANSFSLYAGSTGKIGGLVTEKSTGEGMPGANVLVEGTNLGAGTDLDGNFLVINVPPGTYTLTVMMVGYKTVEVKDVRVNIDRLVKINVSLEEAILEGEVIEVVAEREAVEFDRTNTASYVAKEQIQAMPVQELGDVIQLQAGVVKDAGGGLHIRGGRTREVAYMIDGVPVTNSFSQSGGSNVVIENNFISELQVITGTFNAEYGQAQSGVVNVVTKVPEEKFTGNLELLTGGYYAPNSPMYIGLDQYRPTTDKEARFSFSTPIPFPSSLGNLGVLVNGRMEDNGGWLNGERRFLPEDGWEIEVYREWYQATYDPRDPLVIPIPDSLHNGDGSFKNMNWSNKINLNVKLVYQPTSTLTTSYNLFYSKGNSQSYSSSWRYVPDGTPQNYSDNITHMFILTHAPVQNVFYNLRYSYQTNDWKSYMYESTDDPRYQTTAVNAWDPGSITGFDLGGISSWDRNYFDQKINFINGDITWQINKIIELKGGFSYKDYNLHYLNAPMREVEGHEILQFPYTRNEIRGLEIPYVVFREATRDYDYGNILLRPTSPNNTEDDLYYTEYIRKPKEGAAYGQTRLNMGDIILNAGVRLDYFWPKDQYAPTYDNVNPNEVGNPKYYFWAKPKYKFSPRFGLSFPISSRGALRLSYGHFFQLPSYEKMYQNPVLPHYNHFSIYETRIGNPNLRPEKTIQYEIGLQQELVKGLSFESTVYYKDMRDLLGIEILTLSNATSFYRYVNKEYGNSTGITFALNFRSLDNKLSANIDYTYMQTKGTSSSAEALRDVAILSGPGRGAYTLAVRKTNYLDWDQTHSLNATVAFMPTPTWLFTLLGQYGSGLVYTPSTLNPSIVVPGHWWDNADRKPERIRVDFKIGKSFNITGIDLMLYVNIFNLFNQLDENFVNSVTGHAGPDAYLPEIGRLRDERIKTIGLFTQDEADYNPSWYSRPRFIQIGLNITI